MLYRLSVLLFLVISLARMFYYANSLFYTLNLLSLVVFSLFYATAMSLMDVLLSLMLLIVYVGAMLILIGYFCAVCPNMRLSPVSSLALGGLIVVFLFFFTGIRFHSFFSLSRVLGFFVSLYGFHVFITIVVFLFLVLLIVTSQYLSPKGPFRSTSF